MIIYKFECDNWTYKSLCSRPLVSTQLEYRLPVPVLAISKVPITSTSTRFSKYRLSVPVFTEFSVPVAIPVPVFVK